MIRLKLFSLLVLLLHSTPISSSVEPFKIDWSSCKTKAVCVVSKKCFDVNDPDNELELVGRNDIIGGACAVGFWIRPLSSNVWIVDLQVSGVNLIPDKGLFLQYDSLNLVGCISSGGTLKVEANDGLKADFHETVKSELSPDNGYCSFILQDSSSLPKLSGKNTKIIYHDLSSGNMKQVETDTINYFSKVETFVKCDPFSIVIPKNPPKGLIAYKIPNIIQSPDNIDCSSKQYSKLYAGLLDKVSTEVEKVECKASDKTYSFGTSSKMEEVPLGTKFHAYCGVSIGTTCTADYITSNITHANETPPEFKPDDATGVPTLSCKPGSWWLIDNQFYYQGKPTCRKSLNVSRPSGWFIKIENEKEEYELSEAVCTTKKRCEIASKYSTVCPDDVICSALETKGGFSCAQGSVLTVNAVGKPRGKLYEPTKIECDTEKGVWKMTLKDGSSKNITQDGIIYCPLQTKDSKSSEALAGASSGPTIGIGAVAIIALLGTSCLLAFFLVKGRRIKKSKMAQPNTGGVVKSTGSASSASSMGQGSKKSAQKEISKKSESEDMDGFMLLEELPENWNNLTPKERNACTETICQLGSDISMSLFMSAIEAMFKGETEVARTYHLMCTLSFVERDFFHSNQTKNSKIAEAEKIIPSQCYERLRLYLIDRANAILTKYGNERKDKSEKRSIGFLRGIAFIILYRLRSEEDTGIVKTVTEIFKKHKMKIKDASRFAVWGILAHEDCPIVRKQGLGPQKGSKTRKLNMFKILFKSLQSLLKKPREKQDIPEGSKVQHILFALGCYSTPYPMQEVWKLVNGTEAGRLKPWDLIYVMYGREWVWDGVWQSICYLQQSEFTRFCKLANPNTNEFKAMALMCMRYSQDQDPINRKNGRYFERFTRDFDSKTGFKFNEINKNICSYSLCRTNSGKEMLAWLQKHDKREIEATTKTKEEDLANQEQTATAGDATKPDAAAAAAKKAPPSSQDATGVTGKTTEATGATGATGAVTSEPAGDA